MVRRRLSGIVKTSGEKLNQSNRLAAPTCTSGLKNAGHRLRSRNRPGAFVSK
jgi:hypothetical protein